MSLDTPGLWAVTAPAAPALTPLTGDATADIAIVGAGYTGLSAALHAAREGARVVVLDALGIGAGGSGRNVGLVNAGLWIMPDTVETSLSPGNPLPGLLAQAPAAVWEIITRHAIACEARPVGTLHCAPDAAGLGRDRVAGFAEPRTHLSVSLVRVAYPSDGPGFAEKRERRERGKTESSRRTVCCTRPAGKRQ